MDLELFCDLPGTLLRWLAGWLGPISQSISSDSTVHARKPQQPRFNTLTQNGRE